MPEKEFRAVRLKMADPQISQDVQPNIKTDVVVQSFPRSQTVGSLPIFRSRISMPTYVGYT